MIKAGWSVLLVVIFINILVGIFQNILHDEYIEAVEAGVIAGATLSTDALEREHGDDGSAGDQAEADTDHAKVDVEEEAAAYEVPGLIKYISWIWGGVYLFSMLVLFQPMRERAQGRWERTGMALVSLGYMYGTFYGGLVIGRHFLGIG